MKSVLKAENVGGGPSMAVGGPFSARSAVSQVAIVFMSATDTENRQTEVGSEAHHTHCDKSVIQTAKGECDLTGYCSAFQKYEQMHTNIGDRS